MTATYVAALSALEHSGLGEIARHSQWLFTIANVLHVLGAALVVGGIAVFDIALIARRYDEAASIARTAIPMAASGVALQIPTGLVLLSAEATKLGVNPAFYAKMIFIAVGLINVALFHGLIGSGRRAGALKGTRPYGAISLAAWTLALVAGRMIAYL